MANTDNSSGIRGMGLPAPKVQYARVRNRITRLGKRIFIDTPLEPAARWVSAILTARRTDPEDESTIEIMRRVLSSNSCGIDVGAHKGDILRMLIRFAPAGTHFAFEPLPHLFDQLQAKYRSQERIQVLSYAVSDEPGETSFCYNLDSPAYSGLRQRVYPSADDRIRELRVKKTTLDEIIPPQYDVAFLKIDVEGGELPVLKGASNLLKRCRPVVVFEFGRGSAEAYGSTPERLYAFLRSVGFGINTLKGWLDKSPPLSLDQLQFEYDRNDNYYFVATSSKPRCDQR